MTFNPFQVNTYILFNEKKETVFIDPACCNHSEQTYIISQITSLELIPKIILLTHGHIDHIAGCGFLQQYFNIDVFAHKNTEYFISQAPESAGLWGMELKHLPKITKYLKHEQIISLDDISLKVLHTPGHADGSLCYYSENANVAFTGDVLFMQSVGRTDLPTGNMDTLLNCIKNFLLILPPETVIYPGHGPSTTVADEIKYNPFLSE